MSLSVLSVAVKFWLRTWLRSCVDVGVAELKHDALFARYVGCDTNSGLGRETCSFKPQTYVVGLFVVVF